MHACVYIYAWCMLINSPISSLLCLMLLKILNLSSLVFQSYSRKQRFLICKKLRFNSGDLIHDVPTPLIIGVYAVVDGRTVGEFLETTYSYMYVFTVLYWCLNTVYLCLCIAPTVVAEEGREGGRERPMDGGFV